MKKFFLLYCVITFFFGFVFVIKAGCEAQPDGFVYCTNPNGSSTRANQNQIPGSGNLTIGAGTGCANFGNGLQCYCCACNNTCGNNTVVQSPLPLKALQCGKMFL